MVPARSGSPEARVYVRELARFLGERPSKLLKFARSRGFLHKCGWMPGFPRQYYVTEYGAMRLIAYIRAWQAQQMKHGRTIHEWRAYRAEAKKRERLAAKRAAAVEPPDGLSLSVGVSREPES